MAHDKVFSFVKVEDRQTLKGFYLSALGIITMVCIAVMLIASFFVGGQLPVVAGAVGYISFAVAVASLISSMNLYNDNEAYGPMINSALYINIAAVVVHAIVFLMGCMTLIS